MKKLVSLTLAFAMLFAIAVPSYATNKDVKVEVLERRDSLNGNFVEISKLGDFYYYFEKTDDEIISMSLAPDGTIDKYVRDIDSNVIQLILIHIKFFAAQSYYLAEIDIIHNLSPFVGVYDNYSINYI